MKRKTWPQRLQKPTCHITDTCRASFASCIDGPFMDPGENQLRDRAEQNQRTWAVNKEDCLDLLLVKMEVRDQGEKSHTALWTINLKNRNQICCSFNLSTPPRCPPSRPRGRAGEGRRTRRAPPSRGRGRCLRSSTFADHTPGIELVWFSQEQKICQIFLSTPRIRQPVWTTFIRDFPSKVSAEWVGLVTEAILDFKSTSRSRLIWEKEEFQPNV